MNPRIGLSGRLFVNSQVHPFVHPFIQFVLPSILLSVCPLDHPLSIRSSFDFAVKAETVDHDHDDNDYNGDDDGYVLRCIFGKGNTTGG